MPDYLEVWRPDGMALVALEGERLTLGTADENDLTITGDTTVSGLHALLERYTSGWALRDLGSRNGTFVNGERMWVERALRSGDEIRVGRTRLVFRAGAGAQRPETEVVEAAPELTRREKEVLLTLCKPVLSGDLFTEPASLKEIAKELFVSEAAVKQHLANLYDKFAIYDDGERKRVKLANEAIRRGAVSIADLRTQ